MGFTHFRLPKFFFIQNESCYAMIENFEIVWHFLYTNIKGALFSSELRILIGQKLAHDKDECSLRLVKQWSNFQDCLIFKLKR